MKFWQKAFIGILAVFILSINSSLFLIAQYSYSINVKRDTGRALGEFHFIQNSVQVSMDNLAYRDQAIPKDSSVETIMRSFANYYSNQSVYLELWNKDSLLFANTPTEQGNIFNINRLTDETVLSQQRTVNDKHYLFVAGKLGGSYSDYSLVYARDLSELYATQAEMTRFLILVSVIVEIVLSLVLVLLLRKLTRPIRAIQKGTEEIAGGVYNRRIEVRGKDEFHDLAENFNQMAESIEHQIAALDKTAQDKQNLVDNLAHELRTPLTAIQGYAEFLQNAHAKEEDRITAATYILSETQRMKNLSFKLLDLALLRNNPLDIRSFQALKLLEQVQLAIAPKLMEKAIQLEFRCELKTMLGDFILLQSLLVNLVDNAAKASSKGARIRLSAYEQNIPVLEVEDFGCGMEQDQVENVIEPFYRVDKARSRSTGGVGLGLSLCAQIARLHGAELSIQSIPNQGTKVQVRFTTPLQLRENFEMPIEV